MRKIVSRCLLMGAQRCAEPSFFAGEVEHGIHRRSPEIHRAQELMLHRNRWASGPARPIANGKNDGISLILSVGIPANR